jgi:hypothetical protein
MKRRVVAGLLVLAFSIFGLLGCKLIVEKEYEVLVAEFRVVFPEGELLTGQWVKLDASASRIEKRKDSVEIELKGLVAEPTKIVGYQWDFRDGTGTEILASPVTYHRYDDDGKYTVKLTVFASNGCSATTKKVVEVYNRPPIADFNSGECSVDYGSNPAAKPLYFKKEVQPKGIIEEPIYCRWFDATPSDDPDGYIVTYSWLVENVYTGEHVAYGSGQMVWGYFKPGTYWVTLTVTDDDGAVDSLTKTIWL